MGRKAVLALMCWLAAATAEEQKVVNSSVVSDNVSAESAPRLYPEGFKVYASGAPYTFTFLAPDTARASSQIVPVKEENVFIKNQNGFLKDSYGNQYKVGSPQAVAYRTTFPQQYVRLQDLPVHLSQPLVSGFNFNRNGPQFSYNSPTFHFPTLSVTPTPIVRPEIPSHGYASNIRGVSPGNVGYSVPHGSPQQQPSNSQAVYANHHKTGYYATQPVPKFQRLEELKPHGFQIAQGSGNLHNVKVIHSNKHNLQQALGGGIQGAPAKQVTVTTYNNGKKATVTLQTQPVLPLLDLNLLEPLHFDNPIVPQVQHFLPKINYPIPQVEQEQHNNVFVVQNTKSYDSGLVPQSDSNNNEQNDDEGDDNDEDDDDDGSEEEEEAPPPPQQSKKPTQKPHHNIKPATNTYEINSPNHKETYNEQVIKYDKKTESDPVHHSYNKKTETVPVTWSFTKSSKAPVIDKHISYEVNGKGPNQQIIIHSTPESNIHHREEEHHHEHHPQSGQQEVHHHHPQSDHQGVHHHHPQSGHQEVHHHHHPQSDHQDFHHHHPQSGHQEDHHHHHTQGTHQGRHHPQTHHHGERHHPQPHHHHPNSNHNDEIHHHQGQSHHQKGSHQGKHHPHHHQEKPHHHHEGRHHHPASNYHGEHHHHPHSHVQDEHRHHHPSSYHQGDHHHNPQSSRQEVQPHSQHPQGEPPQESEESEESQSEESGEQRSRDHSGEEEQDDEEIPSHQLKAEHREGHNAPRLNAPQHHTPNHPPKHGAVPQQVISKVQSQYGFLHSNPSPQFHPTVTTVQSITPEFDEEDIRILTTDHPNGQIIVEQQPHQQNVPYSEHKQLHQSNSGTSYDDGYSAQIQVHPIPRSSPTPQAHYTTHKASVPRVPHPQRQYQSTHPPQQQHANPSPSPQSLYGNSPHVIEKSRKIIIQEETPDEMHMLREQMVAEMINQGDDDNEEDFEKAYKEAAIGFPAYERNTNIEKDIYNPDSYGAPKYKDDDDFKHSPFQQYQEEGDEFPKSARLTYKDGKDNLKEDYFLDYTVHQPESYLDMHKSKVAYYKMFKKQKPKYYFGLAPEHKQKKSEKKLAADLFGYNTYQKPKQISYFANLKQAPNFEYNYAKEIPKDSFAYASSGPIKTKTLFVEPQFQYGFEPSSLPRLLDSELSAMATNNSPESEKPGTRKKIYQETFHIKKTSTASEPAS